jgi:hypothetical protein
LVFYHKLDGPVREALVLSFYTMRRPFIVSVLAYDRDHFVAKRAICLSGKRLGLDGRRISGKVTEG